jgi:hypothetical protein
MLKTVESLFVVILVFTTMFAVQSFIQLPSPRLASSIGLQEQADSTLKSLDINGALTQAAFAEGSNWSEELMRSLDDCLPPNTVYKLTAYKIEFDSLTGDLQYIENKTGPGNMGNFPSGAISTSYMVTSPDVTVTQTPEKISSRNNYLTLYILNCDDANGWWITGFTGQTLAQDVYDTMSPYFLTTIMVNSTSQLDTLLSGLPITSNPNELVEGAVVINTFGETVPIPASKAATYSQYPYAIGKRVNMSNWTWVSIVGYPFFYTSNTVSFAGDDNGWGIHGTKQVGSKGLNYFLEGLDYTSYPSPVENTTWITSEIPGVIYYTDNVREYQDYYGLYTGQSQTSSRALPITDMGRYHLTLPVDSKGVKYTNIFNPVTVGGKQYYAGATWVHRVGGVTHGSFMAIGLVRTPDIRVSLIGLLDFYHPKLLRTEFSISGTSRLVELQISQMGAN